MKILIVRDRESAGGGIHNYYQAIAPYLQSQIRFLGIGRPHDCYGTKREWLYRYTPVRLFLEWLSLAWHITVFRPNVFVANPGLDPEVNCRGLFRDAVSIRIASLFSVPVLVFWRGWYTEWCGKPEFPGGNGSWISRAYRKASAQIVLAGRFKEDLRKWGFSMPIHVETTVASDECLQAEPAHGPKDGTINLLYLSRVEVAKGVFELLEAYKILKESNLSYQLTIAGDGPNLVELKEYAVELGLDDVSFPGFVSGEDKIACYQDGSIFCFPSYTEGMPNAVLEALAFGLPVVASEAGGLRDILEEGKTGARFALKDGEPKKRFDPVEMAEVIDRLASNAGLRREISSHNITYARERFAASKVAARLEAIFEDVLEASTSGLLNDQEGGSSNSLVVSTKSKSTKQG